MNTNSTNYAGPLLPNSGDEEQALRVTQLAASRSLLDPNRRSSRRDVVISTLIAVLAEKQPMAAAPLFKAIRSLWKTSTLDWQTLDNALLDARAAGLIIERDSNGQQIYSLSSEADAETEQDMLHMNHLLSEFRDQISKRLDDYPDANKLVDRQDRIMREVLTAIATACQGTFEIEVPGSSRSVRPISISQLEVAQYADRLNPKSIRLPVKELALDALDSGDSFGNELVHLIIVSGLLLGLAAQQGVVEAPTLEGTALFLDTSFLINIVRPDDSSELNALNELISLSNQCDAMLIVPEHTVQEWSRLWDSGDTDVHAAGNRIATISSTILSRHINNPFVAEYVEYTNGGGSQGWGRWSNTRRDLRKLLQQLPIKISRYTERGKSDSECYNCILEFLTEMSENKAVRATRTKAAAEADAMTATMINRRRTVHGENSAIFLANENLTNHAYAKCFPESQPLVIPPMIWLQYISCLIVDDPQHHIEIADLIADVALRNTVLGMAGSYTLEEIADFSNLLTNEGIPATAQIMRDLEDVTPFHAADELAQELEDDFKLRAHTVLSKRSSRRNQRAANREARLQSELDAMQLVVNQHSAEADAQRTRAESEEQRANEATLENKELAEKNKRKDRVMHAGAASGLALIFLIALVSWGLLGWIAILLGVVVAVLGILYAYQWIGAVDGKPRRMWISASCQVVWNIILSIVF